MAAVDVLDRELPALQLVLPLLRVGPGARHRDADGGRAALDAGRVGADRRVILGGRPSGQSGQGQAPGQEQAVADELPARVTPGRRCLIAHGVLLDRKYVAGRYIVGRYYPIFRGMPQPRRGGSPCSSGKRNCATTSPRTTTRGRRRVARRPPPGRPFRRSSGRAAAEVGLAAQQYQALLVVRGWAEEGPV